MNTIGIDFGTSFCTAAWINPATSKPEAISFYSNSNQKMPSVVYYGKDEIAVGEAAYAQYENCYSMNEQEREEVLSSIIHSIKRNMQKDRKLYVSHNKTVTDVDIISDILKFLKEDVESCCFNGNRVEKAIITHPVKFEGWKKEMIIQASKLAGFKEIELLQEPVAAAIGFASTTPNIGNGILVYDFGGGTFDVAYVLKDEDGYYRVPIAPEGDANCGGNDIDMILYSMWERETLSKHNRTICNIPDRADEAFLMRCRKQKENLSAVELRKFSITLPPPDFKQVELTIHRNDFSQQISPIIDKTIYITQQLVKKVQEAGYKIDTAIMIGGSSRIPVVYEKLEAILPVKPRRVMQVDVAVALGAVLFDKIKNNPATIEAPQIIHKPVFCIYCGFKIHSSDKFCIKCGKKNANFLGTTENKAYIPFCPKCNNKMQLTDKFCNKCGNLNPGLINN